MGLPDLRRVRAVGITSAGSADMDEGRRRRLAYIGFPDDEAAELSALHTRNFM
jgi:hypothetical protein